MKRILAYHSGLRDIAEETDRVSEYRVFQISLILWCESMLNPIHALITLWQLRNMKLD